MRSWASNSTITPPTRQTLNAGYPTRYSSRQTDAATPFSESAPSTSGRTTRQNGRLPPVEKLIIGEGPLLHGLPFPEYPAPFWDAPHGHPLGTFPPFAPPRRTPPRHPRQPPFAPPARSP